MPTETIAPAGEILQRPNEFLATFKNGIWSENATLRLLIGMCPTLAVTVGVKPAFTMGMCVVFVLICSNVVVSLMRNLLKPHLRIIMFTLAIATFVTICDLYLRAFQPVMSQTLGPYVALIIVNCLIIFRAEACAAKSRITLSAFDGLCFGIGFTISLCTLAAIRELLATGKIAEVTIMPSGFVPWAGMQMPVGAFVTLGLLIGLVNLITIRNK